VPSSGVAVILTQGSAANLSLSSALATDGASDLGAASGRALAAAGSFVVVCDIDDTRGQLLARELQGSFVHWDITHTDNVLAAITEATWHAPLRAVVNCAGIA
jgi:NAD(P)-dependent dehydrogenase (short-subunit alcohol dehydrogenase family)